MDVTGELVLIAQNPQDLDHLFTGIVGVLHYAGAQKQPFDIVAAIELQGEVGQLPGFKGGPGGVAGAAVDTVFAVIGAVVGEEDFP